MSKRADAIGFFWEDLPPEPKAKAEKVKRTPPERTWEHPDYLPGLYEALAFNVPMMNDHELYNGRGGELVFDTECYRNFWQLSLRCVKTKKLVHFELSPDTNYQMNLGKLEWVLHNYTIIGFNSISYDMPMVTLALAGKNVNELKLASDMLIIKDEFGETVRPQDLLRHFKVKKLKHVDHIDLIEVAPLEGSLKKYAARLHAPRMQDLPFHPKTILTSDQMAIVRWYCINSDIPATMLLREALDEPLKLRTAMSEEYDTDLRSKSDAQMSEAIIGSELYKLEGKYPKSPDIPPGTVYRYQKPAYIKFQTPLLNWALDIVCNTDLIVSAAGNIPLPDAMADLRLCIGAGVYKLGAGGLHSNEKKYSHIADHTFRILDRDVESFYPRIILNQGLFPKHLGYNFLKVFDTLVTRRLHAKHMAVLCKKEGQLVAAAVWKTTAESLKITINGTFGKLGNVWSIMYAPDLLLQVTLSGQLSLLMLIERMELACIPVISANTDGIVMRVQTHLQATYDAIVKQWEKETNFVTEETEYSVLMSRDVNNYIALKKDGDSTKNKGAFANPWSTPNNTKRMEKNPANMICTEAIEKLVTKGIAIEKTIRECCDITKFITVRDVKGGGVKIDDTGATELFMGKMVRWYYAKDAGGKVVYAGTGNLVARSEGAKPCMDLPAEFPQDVDFDWYIKETEDMLAAVGYA